MISKADVLSPHKSETPAYLMDMSITALCRVSKDLHHEIQHRKATEALIIKND